MIWCSDRCLSFDVPRPMSIDWCTETDVYLLMYRDRCSIDVPRPIFIYLLYEDRCLSIDVSRPMSWPFVHTKVMIVTWCLIWMFTYDIVVWSTLIKEYDFLVFVYFMCVIASWELFEIICKLNVVDLLMHEVFLHPAVTVQGGINKTVLKLRWISLCDFYERENGNPEGLPQWLLLDGKHRGLTWYHTTHPACPSQYICSELLKRGFGHLKSKYGRHSKY